MGGITQDREDHPMTYAERWREQLAAWAIPERFTAAVDDSPWELPAGAMARRADQRIAAPEGVSIERTAEALDPPGSVLDVGAGAGAASLPLAARITELVAVDQNAGMLAALSDRADTLGLRVSTVVGRWPDVAASVPAADVVVCHHVFYNVPDLAAFALALHEHARRRVVVELTREHPMAVHNPYWRQLHGLDRPDGPTADDAVAVLREAGLRPRVTAWTRPATPWTGDFDEFVEMSRRAVCLPLARRDELVAALRERGVDPAGARPAREVVTVWWDG